jgi:hypothetical protein
MYYKFSIKQLKIINMYEQDIPAQKMNNPSGLFAMLFLCPKVNNDKQSKVRRDTWKKCPCACQISIRLKIK